MARGSGPERWSPGLPQLSSFAGPMQAVGGFFAMSADAVRFVFRRPFQWREFVEQCWFIARVALAPTLLVAIPFTVLVSFTLNILLRELGAADLSGAGAAFGAVTQIGPIVADMPDVARDLSLASLGSIRGPVMIDVPDHQREFYSWLLRCGFERQRGFTRMLRGRSRPFDRPHLIMAITGPEFG